MRILVSGADGYIGHPLCNVLRERGHDVVGLDSGFYRDGWLYGRRPNQTCYLTRDTRDVQDEDLCGFDGVIHLAELSNDPLGEMNRSLTHAINERGSIDFATRCRDAGIPRFVYSSSCSVYGAGSGDIKTEDSAVDPRTAYAECKLLVEQSVSQLASDEFSPTFLRNATAFGASPRMRFDIVLNNLSGLAWTTREIKMTSDGTPWRPLVHVLDIAQAMALTLEAPRETVHNQVFNVGSNLANYRIREIAEIVASVFTDCRLSVGSSNGDDRSYRVCFDRIHQTLPGFSCLRDAEVGASELKKVFEEIGMQPETFGFRAFARLKQIRHLIAEGRLDENLRWTMESSCLK